MIKPKIASVLSLDHISHDDQYILTRKVLFSGEIEECTVKEVSQKILLLNHLDPKADISLIIDSYGGEVYSGLFLFDLIEAISNDVEVWVIGKAMSAAFTVVLGGKKGRRFISPNSTMMQHEISSAAIGKLTELEVDVEESKRLETEMNKILRSRTKLPEKIIKKFKYQNVYFNAKEALKYGIVDGIKGAL